MKLSPELLQEFKERLIEFYSDESLFSMSASISVESKVNLFGQFMLEKTLEKQVTGGLCNIEDAICYYGKEMVKQIEKVVNSFIDYTEIKGLTVEDDCFVLRIKNAGIKRKGK